MPTIASVHAALDQATAAAFPTTPVLYGNTDNQALSQGTASYLKQRVHIVSDNQLDLGRPNSSRKRGVLIFIVHTRKNIGDAARNSLVDTVLKSFRSKVVGGATLLNARILPAGQTENWSLTGVEIPFFFDEQ